MLSPFETFQASFSQGAFLLDLWLSVLVYTKGSPPVKTHRPADAVAMATKHKGKAIVQATTFQVACGLGRASGGGGASLET